MINKVSQPIEKTRQMFKCSLFVQNCLWTATGWRVLKYQLTAQASKSSTIKLRTLFIINIMTPSSLRIIAGASFQKDCATSSATAVHDSIPFQVRIPATPSTIRDIDSVTQPDILMIGCLNRCSWRWIDEGRCWNSDQTWCILRYKENTDVNQWRVEYQVNINFKTKSFRRLLANLTRTIYRKMKKL